MEKTDKIYYEKDITIDAHQVDCENVYGLVGIITSMQCTISEHTAAMKIDFSSIIKEYNAFWVILKMKIQILKQQRWGSRVTIATYPLPPSTVRCDRECLITDEDGDIVARSTGEWCVLDQTTKRPRRVSSINYDNAAERHITETAMPVRAERIIYTPAPEDFAYERVVRMCDLDVNYHTNNVAYTRFALDAFSAEYFRENTVSEYDINFENQSYEGETLRIYKKLTAPDTYVICGDAAGDGRRVFTAKLIMTKR